MPSSDTSSGSWSESDTEESMSSTSMANERPSSLEGSSVSTDEEVGSTAEVEEEDASPRESLRKWKGHDRYQRKCQRASTSRQSQDPSTTNTDPTMDNGDNQQ
ncbi:hypothetical protein SprV_0301121900 [Sparganum proliferum]